MERHEASRRLRQLPAYLLELLDAEERGKLEKLLAEDVSLQQALSRLREAAGGLALADGAHVGERAMEALLDATLAPVERREALVHLMGCRDCRFAFSVLLAAREDEKRRDVQVPGSAQQGWRARLARMRRGGWTGAGLAAAALVLITVVGVRWGMRGAPVRASLVVPLAAERTEAAELSFSTRGDVPISLMIETVFPQAAAEWQLVRDPGVDVATGTLAFDPQGPALRSIALTFAPQQLTPGPYILVLRSPDGALERQWRFRVTE